MASHSKNLKRNRSSRGINESHGVGDASVHVAESQENQSNVHNNTYSVVINTSNSESSSDSQGVYRRERNRIHAQKTRERKKHQIKSLLQRIKSLRHRSIRLELQHSNNEAVKTLTSMRRNSGIQPLESCLLVHPVDKILDMLQAAEVVNAETEWKNQVAEHGGAIVALITHYNSITEAPVKDGDPPILTSNSSVTSQQRLKLRRERNRIHASRARGKRKLLLDAYTARVCVLEARNNMLLKKLERDHFCFSNLFPKPELSPVTECQEIFDDTEMVPEDITALWEFAQCIPLLTSDNPYQIPNDNKQPCYMNGKSLQGIIRDTGSVLAKKNEDGIATRSNKRVRFSFER